MSSMNVSSAGCAGVKQMMPLVSVLMPMLNAARTVRDAIRSILRQTYSHWELLILDDGSEDESLAMARGFGDRRIRVLAGKHLGLGAQLNRGVGLAAGAYCARMDADDVAYAQRLATQVSYLEEHREVDLVGSSIAVFQRDGRLLGVRRTRESHEELCARPWASIAMPHPSWMGRRQWFVANPYRAELRGMEDRELLARSCGSSRFGGITDVLLAYREDSLSLKKQLIARGETMRHLCGSTAPGTGRQRAMLLASQTCCLGLEAVASATGLGGRLQRTRSCAASREERREFEAVWLDVLKGRAAMCTGEVAR